MSLEIGCNQCSHYCVCNVKDNLAVLKNDINNLAKLLENQNFTITVKCKFYDNNEIKFRSKQGE